MTDGMMTALAHMVAGPPEQPPSPPHPGSKNTPHESASAESGPGDRPDRCEEFELANSVEVRFDEPTLEEFHAAFPPPPVLLERRGLTPQAAPPDLPRKTPEWQQEFWAKQTLFKLTVAAKLREAGRPTLAGILDECHTRFTTALCGDCGRTKQFPNRCDSFFCPECQPRLAAERKKAVEWWTMLVCQPKHVVLTVRNIPDLSKAHVQEFKGWWGKLRRRKFAKHWQGGFYSLEVTNEGNGWHLHLHALVDAKWIDKQGLSDEWRKITNGLGYIVEVKDARGKSYLQELVKYAVKGSDLAGWKPTEIARFIDAFDGVRQFGVFGTLYGARTKFAEYIATIRAAKPKCECGSCNVRYFSESEWLMRELEAGPTRAARPPTPDTHTLELFPDQARSAHSAAAMAR
jgi:hypothetical protein